VLLERLGLDFCWRGRRPLAQACGLRRLGAERCGSVLDALGDVPRDFVLEQARRRSRVTSR
jgi:hypothetical protein